MKVGIVGPELAKWKPEQIPKAKDAIYDILHGLPIEVCNNRVGGNYEIAKLWTEGRQDELVVVSGHCPVGEEQFYCCTCDDWVATEQERETLHKDHIVTEVYNKGGVDTWTEIIATKLGLRKEIYPAPARGWNDKELPLPPYYLVDGKPVSEIEGRIDVRRGFLPSTKEGCYIARGYHSRNIQIAEALPPDGVLYCIVSHSVDLDEPYYCRYCKMFGHVRNGGCWTKRYADSLGKETHLVVIR